MNMEQHLKTIGILGGMSATSTQIYYRELCRLTRERLGGLHSPELLIRSVDFDEIEKLQASSDWDAAGRILNDHAIALQRGGADLLILATNTMHKVADKIVGGVSMPFVHIADATATAILDRGFRRPGLMATAFTMEQTFYTDRLIAQGLWPEIPEADDRAETHRIIYDELCRDIVRKESRLTYERIAQRLVDKGCDCLILGCTEVGMLLNQDNVGVPVFDTTLVHCNAALEAALQ
ncbi:UNVERIFIED_ORG: aspartate racemase [Rhizobium sp. SORGH_AS260]|nr:aspartate racemase [Rhizobium sp. SORGH_AS_0285]MDP9757101.1 aspartate racemase [Rhizobium sp. SORGH_AS_0260]MDR6084160.1 aspartate racemase [Agrobacterium sp. SORGH_AS_0440]